MHTMANDLCSVVMPSEKNIILELNQYLQSAKVSPMIYAGLESLIKIVDECENNPEKSSSTKVAEHIPCGHSLFSIGTFDGVENEHDV